LLAVRSICDDPEACRLDAGAPAFGVQAVLVEVSGPMSDF
jgi:hypothetical protein